MSIWTKKHKKGNDLLCLMKKIYVLGNPLVKQDSFPVNLIPLLKKEFPKIEFIEFEPTEDFPKEKEFVILDTVINAKEVCVITDIDKIISERAVSLHDFDLGYNLKLMKKFGMIEKVTIIGVPPNYDMKKALEEIKKIITRL
jgi:Ni,Fe-hydrogenase maturation factor